MNEQNSDNWSGTVKLSQNKLLFTHQKKELINLPINKIRVIGEMTSQADGFSNDWYVIFVDDELNLTWIPMYANHLIDPVLEELGAILNYKIVPKLYASITFNSNTIFPKELDGKAFFDFVEDKPQNIFEKIGKFLGFGKPVVTVLREEIENYINNQSNSDS